MFTSAERGEVRPLKSRRQGCTCSDGDNTRAGYALAMLCLASCRQLDVMVSYFSHEGPDVGEGSMLLFLAGYRRACQFSTVNFTLCVRWNLH